jgi:hypothetical protein
VVLIGFGRRWRVMIRRMDSRLIMIVKWLLADGELDGSFEDD